jgi:hypothetical protein
MKTFTILWTSDDVKSCGVDHGYTLTDADAEKILEKIENDYDCNHGVTWETILWAIKDYADAEICEDSLNN